MPVPTLYHISVDLALLTGVPSSTSALPYGLIWDLRTSGWQRLLLLDLLCSACLGAVSLPLHCCHPQLQNRRAGVCWTSIGEGGFQLPVTYYRLFADFSPFCVYMLLYQWNLPFHPKI